MMRVIILGNRISLVILIEVLDLCEFCINWNCVSWYKVMFISGRLN